MEFTGLAQKAPNINLDLFVGKEVFIKFNKTRQGIDCPKMLGVVSMENRGEIYGNIYKINGFQFTPNGTRYYYSDQRITEIYDSNAFNLELKEIIDPSVEKVIEAIKKLNMQQKEELRIWNTTWR
jgi:hypothetical protein